MAVSRLVTTVRPGFPLPSLSLVLCRDADSSPVAYFATYVACVVHVRTMFSTKTVVMFTVFACLSYIFYHLHDVGGYYHLWWLSVMFPVAGEVG